MKINHFNLIALIFFASIVADCFNLFTQELRLQNYQSQLEVDLELAMEENKTLNQAINYYKTRNGVEELARQRLGYYQKGEVPLRIISEKTAQNSPD